MILRLWSGVHWCSGELTGGYLLSLPQTWSHLCVWCNRWCAGLAKSELKSLLISEAPWASCQFSVYSTTGGCCEDERQGRGQNHICSCELLASELFIWLVKIHVAHPEQISRTETVFRNIQKQSQHAININKYNL